MRVQRYCDVVAIQDLWCQKSDVARLVQGVSWRGRPTYVLPYHVGVVDCRLPETTLTHAGGTWKGIRTISWGRLSMRCYGS